MIVLFKGLKRPGQCLPNVVQRQQRGDCPAGDEKGTPGLSQSGYSCPQNGEADGLREGFRRCPPA